MNILKPPFFINRHVCLALAVNLILLGYAVQAIAAQHLFEGYKKIIVIDPGHGGQDSGARGPDGTLEKKVTLELARQIAAELEPEFKVVLTRNDDYHVDLDNRTSAANHLKANLFISIHTGAGFTHSTAGTAIYYYQNLPNTYPEEKQISKTTRKKSIQPILWKNIQIEHLEQSQALARKIADRLDKVTPIQIRVEGSPLAVLQGAAMPAVLIEIGYLTNPAEEKQLRDDRVLLDLAEQVRRGIEDFITQNMK
jgi:N-acetylmuramoyl-L-alanine amidase